MPRADLTYERKPSISGNRSRPRVRHVAIPVLVLASLMLAACSSATSGASHPTASGGSTVTGSTIVIKNFSFSPDSISVKPGAAVTVENEDGVAHTLTSDSGAFDTGSLNGGSTTHFTAPTKPGSYPYRCSIHQFMTGTVVVT